MDVKYRVTQECNHQLASQGSSILDGPNHSVPDSHQPTEFPKVLVLLPLPKQSYLEPFHKHPDILQSVAVPVLTSQLLQLLNQDKLELN